MCEAAHMAAPVSCINGIINCDLGDAPLGATVQGYVYHRPLLISTLHQNRTYKKALDPKISELLTSLFCLVSV